MIIVIIIILNKINILFNILFNYLLTKKELKYVQLFLNFYFSN